MKGGKSSKRDVITASPTTTVVFARLADSANPFVDSSYVDCKTQTMTQLVVAPPEGAKDAAVA